MTGPRDHAHVRPRRAKLVVVGLRLGGRSSHHFNELLGYKAASDLLGLNPLILLPRSVEHHIAAELSAQPLIDLLIPLRDVSAGNTVDQLVAFADARSDLASLWAAIDDHDPNSPDILLFPYAHPFVLSGIGEWLAGQAPERRPSVFFRFIGDEIIVRATGRNNSAAAILIRLACSDLRKRPGQERVFLLADTPQLARMLTRICCRRVFAMPIPKFLGLASNEDFWGPGKRTIYIHLNQQPGVLLGELEQIIRLTAEADASVSFMVGSKALSAEKRTALESSLGSLVQIIPEKQNAADYLANFSSCSIVLLPYERQAYRDCSSGVFVEAASFGKIVVAPAGTWMEQQMAAGHGAGTTFAEPTAESVAAALLRALADSDRLGALARTLAPKVRETNSCRRYIELMMDLARQPPDMRPIYQLGEDIDFSSPLDSRCFMGEGWGETEDWGVWTVGRQANLKLRLGSRSDRDLVLKALVQPFLARKHPRISVRVAASGDKIAQWRFDIKAPEAAAPRWCEAVLPVRSLANPEGELDITFTVDAPASPLSAGLSDDARLLGLGLRRLVIVA